MLKLMRGPNFPLLKSTENYTLGRGLSQFLIVIILLAFTVQLQSETMLP